MTQQTVRQELRRGRDRLVVRVVAIVMVATILPLAFMAVLTDHMATEALMAARIDGLRQSSVDGVSHVQSFFDGLRWDGQVLSRIGGMADYVGAVHVPGKSVSNAIDNVAEEANGLLISRRVYETFALLDADGKEQLRLLYHEGLVERVAEQSLKLHPALGRNSWQRQANAPLVADMDFDATGRTGPNLVLLVPITAPSGQRVSTLVLSLEPGVLDQLLDTDSESGQVAVLLSDNQGSIISGWLPEGQRRPKDLSESFNDRWQSLLTREETVFETLSGFAAVSSPIAWDRLDGDVWHIVALIPTKAVMAPVRKLNRTIILLSAVMMLLSLVAGLVMSRRLLIDPLGDLLGVIRRFRDGDLSVRSPPHSGELGELTASFNEMAETLDLNNRTLETMVADRTQALEREVAERRVAQTILIDAIESMQDAFMVYDAESRLVLANTLARRFAPPGMASRMKLGMPMEEFFRGLAQTGHITSSLGREDEWVAERCDSHRTRNFDIEERLEDGRWLNIRGWRTPEGACVFVCSDITERKRSQRDLQISERRFRDLFDNMQDSALILRAEAAGDGFRITDLNHAAQVLERVDRDAVVGKSQDEVFPALRRLGTVEALSRVWREHRPERLSTYFYDDLRAPGWRDTFLFPLSTGEVVAIYRDVSAECQAEEALLRSEERYRILVETMSEGLIVTDPEMVIAYVNDRFTQLAGRSQNELVGRRLDEAFSPESRDLLLRGQDRSQLGADGPFEASLDAGEGRVVDVLVSPAPFHDTNGTLVGQMSVVTDITPLKQAQTALKDSESRFRSIFQGAPFGMVLIDGDGCLAEANRAFKTILDGNLSQGLMGRPLADLGMAELLAALSGPGARSWEGKVQLPDGRSVWLQAHAAMVGDLLAGRSGLIATIEDVSRRKELEERMAHSSKLMLLGEMSAGLAHEITQPLNIIRLTSEATLARMDCGAGGVTMEESYGKLKIINDQADRLFDVIDYMQAFSRRESEKREPFDLFVSVKAAVALVSESFRQKKIVIQCEISSGPCVLLGHARQLEQVVLNLLTNARDAITDLHGADGGRITVTARRENDSNQAILMVEDQGKGIPEADLQRIFEPFFSTKGPGKGTGLGLSISLGIVSGLGGAMRAEKGEEGGARFVVEMPLPAMADVPCTPAPVEPAEILVEIPPAEAKHFHIMLVEDEELAAEEMADYLTRAGYRVTLQFGGQDALAAFIDDPADLVVTDLNMPDGDGRMLIEGLLEDYPYLPIIVVTGRPNTRSGELEDLAAGSDVILRKPIRLRELGGHIKRLLA